MRRVRTWTWVIGLVLWGCASAPKVKVAAEVFDPQNARNRSLAVVTDLFMDDPVEADRLAGLIRRELTANGFKVQDVGEQAELVVIPTIERSTPSRESTTPSSRPSRAWPSFELSYGSEGSKMMESQNALRNLGFEFQAASAAAEAKVGLIVTAVTREAWFEAAANQGTEISKVWRIIAVTRLGKEDIFPNLVEAVGSKLNEVSRARSEPQTRQTNSMAPKPELPGSASWTQIQG